MAQAPISKGPQSYLPPSELLSCGRCCLQQSSVLSLHLCCFQPCVQGSSRTLQLKPLGKLLECSCSSCPRLLLLLYALSPPHQRLGQQLLLAEAQGLGQRLPLGCTPGGLVLPALQYMPVHHLLPVLVSPAVQHNHHHIMCVFLYNQICTLFTLDQVDMHDGVI